MLAAFDYRYVRSFGVEASLHAVTFRGIDDFLASDESSDGGVVMLLHGPAGRETGGLHGGPDIGAIMREMKGMPTDMQMTARPMAVLTITPDVANPEVGEMLARRLMCRVEGSASTATDDLGAYEALVDDLAEAIPQVLGVNPFQAGATLN